MKNENVLIIDAEESSKSLLSTLMKRLDCSFSVETDPKKALTHLKDETFTLVVAELSLFEPQGIRKVQDSNPDMPFMFIGHSLGAFSDHINPSMSDFLPKPFGLEEAELRLRRIILQRDTCAHNQEQMRELKTAKDELQRKNRELELSVEDLEHIKHLYKEIGNELTATTEELRQANHQLEVLAITDGLTDVYNHRYFMDQIQDKFENSKKRSKSLSLLMIDIDHFKAFNDNHGHMTGDAVLRSIARLLKSSCRKNDIVARYGGEEFAIILPETDSKEAETIAEKTRALVENHQVPNEEGAQRVTISIGIGTNEKGIDSLNALISSADKALYHAKAQGRNRVVFGKPNQPMPVLEWFSRF